MEKITSLQNQLVKQVQELRDARARRQAGKTIIDGEREIERALDAGIIVEKVFYKQGAPEALLKQLLAMQVSLIEVADKVMEKIGFGERNENIIALAKTSFLSLSDIKLSAKPLVVILESLEKPGNLGAILRTCDGAGVEAVFVCDPKTDIYNPNVIRSSTGIVFSLPIICATAEEILAFFKSRKIKIAAATPAANKIYTQADFKGACAIALGSEDKGLSKFWLSAAETNVKIPMKGKADSLNVSTSAAIILYEALRQRQN